MPEINTLTGQVRLESFFDDLNTYSTFTDFLAAPTKERKADIYLIHLFVASTVFFCVVTWISHIVCTTLGN